LTNNRPHSYEHLG